MSLLIGAGVVAGGSVQEGPTAELYGIYQDSVSNANAASYTNPFNYNEIQLVVSITGAENKTVGGFYDGGMSWKWRFMPSVPGVYNYAYSWTGSSPLKPTPPAGGSFTCVDTPPGRYRGPLSVDPANPWYFRDARGAPFDFFGYDTHVTTSPSMTVDINFYLNRIDTEMVPYGANITMLDGLIWRPGGYPSWWAGADDNVFAVAHWAAYDQLLSYLAEEGIYAFSFAGMWYQDDAPLVSPTYSLADAQIFMKYWVARFGAYYNFFGWSPTWEWPDIWSASEVNSIMNFLSTNDPYNTLLTIHDIAPDNDFTWMAFCIRQQQADTLLDGYTRAPDIGASHQNKPIIGSEDIWEKSGDLNHPQNIEETVRAVWGELLCGVMPMYSEWHPESGSTPAVQGTGVAWPAVRANLTWFFANTRYREYSTNFTSFQSLVAVGSGTRVANGITGQEYCVYIDTDTTFTVNLSAATDQDTFNVKWFQAEPGTASTGGTVAGGAVRNFTAPSGDCVLLLTKVV